MQQGKRAGAPLLGRVLPSAPQHAAPMPAVVRAPAITAGAGATRKALSGPLELVQKGACARASARRAARHHARAAATLREARNLRPAAWRLRPLRVARARPAGSHG